MLATWRILLCCLAAPAFVGCTSTGLMVRPDSSDAALLGQVHEIVIAFSGEFDRSWTDAVESHLRPVIHHELSAKGIADLDAAGDTVPMLMTTVRLDSARIPATTHWYYPFYHMSGSQRPAAQSSGEATSVCLSFVMELTVVDAGKKRVVFKDHGDCNLTVKQDETVTDRHLRLLVDKLAPKYAQSLEALLEYFDRPTAQD